MRFGEAACGRADCVQCSRWRSSVRLGEWGGTTFLYWRRSVALYMMRLCRGADVMMRPHYARRGKSVVTLATRFGRNVPCFARRSAASCLMLRGRRSRYLCAHQSPVYPRRFGTKCCVICTRGATHRIGFIGTARGSLMTGCVPSRVDARSRGRAYCDGGCVALRIRAPTLLEHVYVIVASLSTGVAHAPWTILWCVRIFRSETHEPDTDS